MGNECSYCGQSSDDKLIKDYDCYDYPLFLCGPCYREEERSDELLDL